MEDEAKIGRPSLYTEEIADRICERLAEGESLRSICLTDDMPNKATVFRWLALHSEFSDQYARAREAQGDALFDETLDIADDGSNDYITKKNADGSEFEAVNAEHIQRSRLRVDTRKWMASKLQPKKYGDKLDLNVAGTLQTMPEEAIDARITQLLGKAGVGVSADGERSAEEPE